MNASDAEPSDEKGEKVTATSLFTFTDCNETESCSEVAQAERGTDDGHRERRLGEPYMACTGHGGGVRQGANRVSAGH